MGIRGKQDRSVNGVRTIGGKGKRKQLVSVPCSFQQNKVQIIRALDLEEMKP